MPKPTRFKPLSAKRLAMLFTQLKNMELAGLPVSQAFSLLSESDLELKQPLSVMQKQLNAGKLISEAGFKAGIFDNTQKTLIHAAETSGRLAEVYSQLSGYYTDLSSRMQKVKSRLYLPCLVLVISLFVQPIPVLVKSEITMVDYLFMSAGRLTIIGFGVYFLVNLPRLLENIGLGSTYHRLQLRIPVVASWIGKRQINEFFFILALMLEAGVAFAEALPKSVATIKNTSLRDQFKPALAALTEGSSVAETLHKVPVINATALQIIHSSEQSGKLANGLLHFTRLEAMNISLQDEALAEWLPRIVYIIIAIWMAYSILGGQVASVVPSDL